MTIQEWERVFRSVYRKKIHRVDYAGDHLIVWLDDGSFVGVWEHESGWLGSAIGIDADAKELRAIDRMTNGAWSEACANDAKFQEAMRPSFTVSNDIEGNALFLTRFYQLPERLAAHIAKDQSTWMQHEHAAALCREINPHHRMLMP